MNNLIKLSIIYPFLIILSGCFSTNTCCEVSNELLPHPVEPIPLPNEANVQIPGSVKAYAVNRYIDPANPKMMHERHVVYRIEQDPSWRLNTSTNRQILIGNTYSESQVNYNPAIMNQELALELQRQRIANAMLTSTSETLIDTSLELQKQSETLSQRHAQIFKN